LKRNEEKNKAIINEALEIITKVLSIYAPFISEEIWNRMNKTRLISIEKWPVYDEKKIDEEILKYEDALMNTFNDIKQVIKLSNKNKNLYLYVVSEKELLFVQEAIDFLKKELDFEKVKVFAIYDKEKYDPENKAKRAKFGKPGIYVE